MQVIRLNNLTTVEQVTQYTKAGGFCKSCVRPGGHEAKKYYLVDILKQTREEMEKERLEKERARAAAAAAAGGQPDFRNLTLIRKLNAIDQVLTRDVRPRLESDGGDCEVIEVKDAPDGAINVYIQVGRRPGRRRGPARSLTPARAVQRSVRGLRERPHDDIGAHRECPADRRPPGH